jgi:hypothetical protein
MTMSLWMMSAGAWLAAVGVWPVVGVAWSIGAALPTLGTLARARAAIPNRICLKFVLPLLFCPPPLPLPYEGQRWNG